MRGFDPKFKDLPDFIEKITHEIWEERWVGTALEKYYAPDVIVRASNAIITDSLGVAGATLATLHEFPDRRLVHEDVVWIGDGDRGWLSSHRLISVMHKRNDGVYGSGRGQIVRSRIIADCVVRDGVIHEEWLVRDHGSFATGLGMTPEAMARDLAATDLATRGEVSVFNPARDVPSAYIATIDGSREAQTYAEGWRNIWGGKTPALIRRHYHQGATIHAPNGEMIHGHDDIDQFVVSYLASFPDLEFSVDHLIVNRDEGQPTRLALRWSIEATHKGWGRFGRPTGAPIYIMGMTHAYMVGDRVTIEWLQIDEVSIWKQIIAHAPAEATG